MRCGVVRGLWGDVLHQRHLWGKPPEGHFSILREVKESAQAGEQTDMVYCWGEQNYEYCRWLGLPARLMSKSCYELPKRKDERHPQKHGMVLWGCNHFAMKWLLLEAALEDFDVVINADWDLQQVRKVDEHFWRSQEEKANGAAIRAVISVQQNWSWGARWRKLRRRRTVPKEEGTWGTQHVPYMGCMWLASREFVAEAKAWHAKFPKYMAQQVAAWVLDAPNRSRWMGLQEYKRRGHMADFVNISTALEPVNKRTVVWQNVRPRRQR